MNVWFTVSNSKKAVMYNVLHVPKLTCNLFYVRAAAKKGNTVNSANEDAGLEAAMEALKEQAV